jgi:flagellar protein FliO/FliZ
MGWYVLKLLILLPLIGGMVWGSLKLSQVMQNRMRGRWAPPFGQVVETLMLSPTIRLAVLEFHGREILVSTSRHGLTRLAEAPARATVSIMNPMMADDDLARTMAPASPAPCAARKGKMMRKSFALLTLMAGSFMSGTAFAQTAAPAAASGAAAGPSMPSAIPGALDRAFQL